MKNLNLLQKREVIDIQTTKGKYVQNNSITFEALNEALKIILMHLFYLQEI